MRTIIFNGKGGVGKTSVSAATALRLAEKGHRTIIMSVDTAHSLGDSFKVQLGPTIVNVAPNLDALELDIIHEMRTKWSAIRDYISAFMLSQGVDDITAEEMAVLPGMEMAAALFYVLQFKDSGEYDVVIIDTAPTGETLRLLSFPDVSNWYIDKMYGLMKRAISIARMTVGKVLDFPLPSKEVMNLVEELKENMERVKEILEDSENTTIRLVLIPERMAITETRRSYTYLCLYNKTVESLIINKVLPDNADGEFLKAKLEEQKIHMEEIHNGFDPLKIMTAYMMPRELGGFDALKEMADMIYGDGDPVEVYAKSSPMHFESKNGIDSLFIKMPFVNEDSVELFKTYDNSVIIEVGGQKRTVSLPQTLKDAEMLGAEFRDSNLVIEFRRN
jgi:arsenite-transporting ATPase